MRKKNIFGILSKIFIVVLVFLLMPSIQAADAAPTQRTITRVYPEDGIRLLADYTPAEQARYDAVVQNQALYDTILAGLAQRGSSIDISSHHIPDGDPELDGLLDIYSHALYQYGWYFEYVTGLSVSISGSTYTTIHPQIIPSLRSDACEAAFQEKMDQALALVDDSMSDLQKVLILHDFLARTVQYDWATLAHVEVSPDYAHSAYGALVQGNAVCQGYTMAYNALLSRAGIPVDAAYYPGHVWSLVQLDGHWYHVDVTWDDPTYDVRNRAYYRHFLLTDAEMEESHGEPSQLLLGRTCSDTTYQDEKWVFRQGGQLLFTDNHLLQVSGRQVSSWASLSDPVPQPLVTLSDYPEEGCTLLGSRLFYLADSGSWDSDTYALHSVDLRDASQTELDGFSYTKRGSPDPQGFLSASKDRLSLDYNPETGCLEVWSSTNPAFISYCPDYVGEPVQTWRVVYDNALLQMQQQDGQARISFTCNEQDAASSTLWMAFYDNGRLADLQPISGLTGGTNTVEAPWNPAWDSACAMLLQSDGTPLCQSVSAQNVS